MSIFPRKFRLNPSAFVRAHASPNFPLSLCKPNLNAQSRPHPLIRHRQAVPLPPSLFALVLSTQTLEVDRRVRQFTQPSSRPDASPMRCARYGRSTTFRRIGSASCRMSVWAPRKGKRIGHGAAECRGWNPRTKRLRCVLSGIPVFPRTDRNALS